MRSRSLPLSLGLGVVGAAMPCAVATSLPDARALDFWAVLLAVAGTIYIGAALADGRRRALLVETGVGVGFIAMALAGLWTSAWFLVVGWGSHAAWDLVHHGDRNRRWSAPIAAGFYPPACLSFDLVVAGVIIVQFLL